jgi:hypothetical protein
MDVYMRLVCICLSTGCFPGQGSTKSCRTTD